MGGTFDRLVSQGHEVHVAYKTSGNIAVSDQDALKFIEVNSDIMGADHPETLSDIKKAFQSINTQKPAPRLICDLKASIRKRESLAATRYIGIPDGQVHFMNLSFYETGTIKKNPFSKRDVNETISIIESIKPHQIFAAGDLSDPHGTHRVCLNIILESLKLLKPKNSYEY